MTIKQVIAFLKTLPPNKEVKVEDTSGWNDGYDTVETFDELKKRGSYRISINPPKE